MNDVNSLFTAASLASLQGGAGATLLVPNALCTVVPSLTDREGLRRWIGLVTALAISVGLAASRPNVNVGGIGIGALNALLIYTSAFGIQVAGARRQAKSAPALEEFSTRRRSLGDRFWFPW